MLQNIQLGNITNEIWEKLQRKHQQYNPNKPIDLLLNTTNIVGYCETADKINCLICNTLPTIQGKFMISHAIDIINGEQWSTSKTENPLNQKQIYQLQLDFNKGQKSCIETNSVRVSFNVPGGIIDMSIKPHTNYFMINGNHASHCQFPIQNCYALTVHKTQGLTLNNISVSLDDQIFSPGQAYVDVLIGIIFKLQLLAEVL